MIKKIGFSLQSTQFYLFDLHNYSLKAFKYGLFFQRFRLIGNGQVVVYLSDKVLKVMF